MSTVTHLTPDERETIVRTSDGDDLVHIWTNQRKWITQLRNNRQVTEKRHGWQGDSEWADFTLPESRWNLLNAVKSLQSHTPEEKKAIGERLAAGRAAKKAAKAANVAT